MSILGPCQEIINAVWTDENAADRKAVMITASVEGEGVTGLTCNLARVLAEIRGSKVCLIDGNFSNPSLHKALNIENELGFCNILSGECSLSDAIRQTDLPNFDIITVGTADNGKSHHVESNKVRAIIDKLKVKYDFILFDSSGVSQDTAPLVLAGQVDGVVLVVQAGKTRYEVVQKSKEQLEFVRAKVFGVVLNRRKYFIPKFIYRNL